MALEGIDLLLAMRRVRDDDSMVEQVLDGVLVPMVIEAEGLAEEFFQASESYLHAYDEVGLDLLHQCFGQYAMHAALGRRGLAREQLGGPRIASLSPKRRGYIEHCLEHPYRYTFCEYRESLERDFHIMHDILRDEDIIVQSGGLSRTRRDYPAVACVGMLIHPCGECWTTYGPLIPYLNLGFEELRYYAMMRGLPLASRESIDEDVQANLAAWLVLMRASNAPSVTSPVGTMRFCLSAPILPDFDPCTLPKEFRVAEKEGMYHIALAHPTSAPPHPDAYFNGATKTLYVTAMSEEAYRKFSRRLALAHCITPAAPQYTVCASVMTVLRTLAPSADPSEWMMNMFPSPSAVSEGDSGVGTLNRMIEEIMQAYNEGRQPDASEISAKLKIPLEEVNEVIATFLDALKRTGGLR